MIIRPATAADALDVLSWRNDPLARAMSRRSDVVAEADHEAWFGQAIGEAHRTLRIGEVDGQKIGMVRIDRGEETEVSININPLHRGRGLSFPLLSGALDGVAGPLVAEIKDDNMASRRLFERAGFVFETARDGLRRYVRPATAQSPR